VSLDILSGGRLIFGAGLGGPVEGDFKYFGEEQGNPARAAKLDEELEILNGLWSGRPFDYKGEHYNLAEVVFQPIPIQKPRIPIWIGGGWDKPGARKRAARWDGFFPGKREMVSIEEWRTIQAFIQQQRSQAEPCTWVHAGKSPGDDPAATEALVQPYAEMGIDWWVEEINPWRYGHGWFDSWTPEVIATMNSRILQGPPRFSGK
jgi:alkanesulfonate monooxygenase SsuD/methylene tetrahydromethanopterin reductase-like flavin-dependent oxidoreductase (luciferase family)